MSPKKPFPLDPRPAAVLARYHDRARTRRPWLQALGLALLAPLIVLAVRLRVGVRVRVRGREHLPEGGFIISPNHPSVMDPVVIALALRRRVSFMGKSDLFTRRWGRWLTRLGSFPVRRGVWDQDAFQTAAQALDRDGVLFMAWEGGCSPKAGGFRAPKAGVGHVAQIAGATVVPCYLEGTRGLYRPWTWPRLRITFGEPLQIPRDPDPSRESNTQVARQVADAVIALAPNSSC